MKRKLLFLVFWAISISVSAQIYNYPDTTPSGHVLYYNIANGEAEVTKRNYNYPNYGNTLDGDLIIPDSIVHENVTYPVTSIGHEAFEYATMRSVQIPNTVKTIVIRAFCACDSLTSLVIPNSVTSIGMQAFAGSFNITSIVLSDSLTIIEQGIFENDTSLISIVIPDNVISVGYGAFSQCYSLRSVTFGASVNNIGGLLFWNCRSLDSLIFRSNVAPSVGTNLFVGAPDTLLIDIPCGSYHSYYAAFGPNHTYVVPSVNLSMDVSSLAPDWGTATVVLDADQQDVRCDSSAVIQATANYGYHFTGWSNGSMTNPDTLTIDRDSVLTASFAKNSYTVDVNSSDPTIGSVSGGGVFEYLDTIVLSANATSPYHFVRWSDGNTQNPRQYVVTSNAVQTAVFGIDTFSVNLQVDSVTHGTCTGFGNYPYGSAASVVAVPYSGYQFSHWSDGSTFNPYTFAVVNNVQLTAFFYANGTPYQDTLMVHDTVYVDVLVHDTTYITLTDTLFLAETDTLWLHDTIYLPQYNHDTIYITEEGIGDVNGLTAKVYSNHGQIVVEGADGNQVTLYDVTGRVMATKQDRYVPLRFDALASGTYLIKIGSYPARRVVVIR